MTSAASVDDEVTHVTIQHKSGVTHVEVAETGLTGEKLKEFMRYKERKYNAINKLNRICTMLVVFLLLDGFCVALGFSNDSWFSVDRPTSGTRTGFGVFRVCPNTNDVSVLCRSWTSSRELADITCSVPSFTSKVNTMITFASLYAAATSASIVSALAAVLRPTRSKIHVVIIVCCASSIPFGIITIIVHRSLISCVKDQCSDGRCSAGYSWGVYVFVGALCSAFLSVFLASSMRSYVFILRRQVRLQCRLERKLKRERESSQLLLRDEPPCSNPTTMGTPRADTTDDEKRIMEQRTATTNPAEPNNGQRRGHSRNISSSSCVVESDLSFSCRREDDSPPPDLGGGERRAGSMMPVPPQFITAHDMGVEVDGSDDWVYVESSDMFYSFALEMFYDPINAEFFACRRRMWFTSLDDARE